MDIKYRIRRCCSTCGHWEIWFLNRVVLDFPSGTAALSFFRDANVPSSRTNNAIVQLEQKGM